MICFIDLDWIASGFGYYGIHKRVSLDSLYYWACTNYGEYANYYALDQFQRMFSCGELQLNSRTAGPLPGSWDRAMKQESKRQSNAMPSRDSDGSLAGLRRPTRALNPNQNRKPDADQSRSSDSQPLATSYRLSERGACCPNPIL